MEETGMTDKQFLAYVRDILHRVREVREKLDASEAERPDVDEKVGKALRNQSKHDAEAALSALEKDLAHTVRSLEEE